MAKAAKLKVFTAAMGFHDVYVAAPSRAAALRAWGSEHDLFARGMASEVTDAALTHEPLAHPGEVIRRSRGTEAEQLAALPPDRPAPARAAPGKSAKPKAKPKPRPSREKLDAAEAALEEAEARHRREAADAKARVEAAQRAARDLARDQADEKRRLDEQRDAARRRYDAALVRWRGE